MNWLNWQRVRQGLNVNEGKTEAVMSSTHIQARSNDCGQWQHQAKSNRLVQARGVPKSARLCRIEEAV